MLVNAFPFGCFFLVVVVGIVHCSSYINVCPINRERSPFHYL